MNFFKRSIVILFALLGLSAEVYSQTSPPTQQVILKQALAADEKLRIKARNRLVRIASAVKYSDKDFEASVEKYKQNTGKLDVETDFRYYCPMKSASALKELLKKFEADTKGKLAARIIEAFRDVYQLEVSNKDLKFGDFLFEPLKLSSEWLAAQNLVVYTPARNYFGTALVFSSNYSITASVANDPVKGRTYTVEQLNGGGRIELTSANSIEKIDVAGYTIDRKYECQFAVLGAGYFHTLDPYKRDGSTIIRPNLGATNPENRDPFVYVRTPGKMENRKLGSRTLPSLNLVETYSRGD